MKSKIPFHARRPLIACAGRAVPITHHMLQRLIVTHQKRFHRASITKPRKKKNVIKTEMRDEKQQIKKKEEENNTTNTYTQHNRANQWQIITRNAHRNRHSDELFLAC